MLQLRRLLQLQKGQGNQIELVAQRPRLISSGRYESALENIARDWSSSTYFSALSLVARLKVKLKI
jgi:DNA polymerase III delta subunit